MDLISLVGSALTQHDQLGCQMDEQRLVFSGLGSSTSTSIMKLRIDFKTFFYFIEPLPILL
jgi:hypothetical protein